MVFEVFEVIEALCCHCFHCKCHLYHHYHHHIMSFSNRNLSSSENLCDHLWKKIFQPCDIIIFDQPFQPFKWIFKEWKIFVRQWWQWFCRMWLTQWPSDEPTKNVCFPCLNALQMLNARNAFHRFFFLGNSTIISRF